MDIINRMPKQSVRGSSVIEMSYLLALFFGMFIMIIYTVFYFHDKAVINGAASETAILGAQAERKKTGEYDLEGFFHERADGKLIYMTNTDVSVSENDKEITVNVVARKSFMKISVCQKAVISEPEKRLRWIK